MTGIRRTRELTVFRWTFFIQLLRGIASAQAHPDLKQWDDAAANMDKAEKILVRLVDRYRTNKDYQLQLEDTRAGIIQLGKMRKPDGP